jgi:N-carbamoyl-L-amino-acid hydrolase
VLLDVEIRSMDNAILDAAESALRDEAALHGGQFVLGHRLEPVPADPAIQAAIEHACAQLGLPHLRLSSGAGHDAMNMARICPYGMIFVPSEEGLSHAPEEYTRPHHCVDGGRVLLAALLEVDESLR